MKISVALPTYNGEDYLREQLNSIIGQELQPDEIIVSDDGSNEATVTILEEYRDKYPDLITVYKNKCNIGVIKNFEKAIRKCSGDYIALSDQDDIWDITKLEHQTKALDSTEAGLVFHDATIVDEQESAIGGMWDAAGFNPEEVSDSRDVFLELLRRNMVQGASIMFDATLCDELLPIPSEVRHYDHYLALTAHIVSGICPIDERLLQYRQHESQDLGAPPGNQSFYQVLKIGLEKEPSMSVENANQAGALLDFVCNTPDSKFALDSNWVQNLITEKYIYAQNRKRIHTSGFQTESIKALAENLACARYAQFGYGPKGVLNIGRDILGLFGK